MIKFKGTLNGKPARGIMSKEYARKLAHRNGTTSAAARCVYCGVRGRKKCVADVCLNFCCMTEKGRLCDLENLAKEGTANV